MDFLANFRKLSEQFREDKREDVCATLEELVTQSTLLENR